MKKPRLIALLSALMVLAAMVVVVGCGSDDDSSSSGSGDFQSELITEGTLTVGSDIPYAPFEFGKAPDYNGFDIDLVNDIAHKLGVDVKIEDTAFDTIFTDVAQGKFDMVASAATITPEREQKVNFSDPYYEAEQALLVAPGSDITSVEDLVRQDRSRPGRHHRRDIRQRRDRRWTGPGLPERTAPDRRPGQRPGRSDHHRPARRPGRTRQGPDRLRDRDHHPDRGELRLRT